MAQIIEHGNSRAWNQHVDRGERVCIECTEWRQAYDRQRQSDPKVHDRHLLLLRARDYAVRALRERHRQEYDEAVDRLSLPGHRRDHAAAQRVLIAAHREEFTSLHQAFKEEVLV